MAVLNEKRADGHGVRDVPVHITTLVAFLTGAAVPMDAHLGLHLALVWLLDKSMEKLVYFIQSKFLMAGERGHLQVTVHYGSPARWVLRNSVVMLLPLRLLLREVRHWTPAVLVGDGLRNSHSLASSRSCEMWLQALWTMHLIVGANVIIVHHFDAIKS